MGRPRNADRRRATGFKNLARAMAVTGWSQTELAARCGLGVAYVNQLLTGLKRNPSYEALERIASAFLIPVATLVDGRLTAEDVRLELAKASLREASRTGEAQHRKLVRYLDTELAPVTVDGWAQLSKVLAIADRPRRRLKVRAFPRRQEDRLEAR